MTRFGFSFWIIEDCNIPDDQENVGLHTTVLRLERDNMDMWKLLLQQSHIDVNYRTCKGETPLLLCLKQKLPGHLCRTQSQSKFGIAIWNQLRADNFRKLIENGADINAKDWNGYTALHYAVIKKDLEAVCMLLYYGIDVSILCDDKMTAFTFAIHKHKLGLAEVLFDYYDDFSNSSLDGHKAMYWAAYYRSPLALKLVEAGADMNRVLKYGNNVLEHSLRYRNAELFKLIWPKFDHRLLLEGRRQDIAQSFMKVFLEQSYHFSASDWVECMYLILESPVAFDLLSRYNNYHCTLIFLCQVLNKLSRLKVKRSDRMGIIASCLSLGMGVSKNDINKAFALYGFGKELELFIYGVDVYDRYSYSGPDFYLLLWYIFAQEDELSSEKKISLLYRQYIRVDCRKKREIFLHSLNFFALPFDMRQQLQLWPNGRYINTAMIRDRLNNVPELPSLLELARNKTRQYIRQNYKVDQPYHMHDVVKSLNLPQRVRDIILFKTPIYK